MADPQKGVARSWEVPQQRRIIWLLVRWLGGQVTVTDTDLDCLPDVPELAERYNTMRMDWTLTAVDPDIPGLEQPDERQHGDLREQLIAQIRRGDRLVKSYRALTHQVLAALTRHEHEMTMYGGLPFCRCGLSLADGDATGSMITHLLGFHRDPLLTDEPVPEPPGIRNGMDLRFATLTPAECEQIRELVAESLEFHYHEEDERHKPYVHCIRRDGSTVTVLLTSPIMFLEADPHARP